MGAFSYGWDSKAAGDTPEPNQNNPLNLGGAAGSQVNSQTAGQGAGITPMGDQSFQPSYDYGFKNSEGPGGISGMGTPYIGTMQTQTEPQRAESTPQSREAQPQQPAAQAADFSGMLQKVQTAATPQDAAVAQDQLARNLFSTLSDAGHDVKWQDQGTLMVDGRAYTVAGSQSGGSGRTYSAQDWLGSVQQPNLPSDLEAWRPNTGTLYTPGDINFNDIPEFTRESLMNELMGGETNQRTDALVNDILKNPTALSDQVVDTLKAQQKNLLSEQQQQEEEDLRGFGASAGIDDSRWLANQMAQSRRGRDTAYAKAAQDVDVKAAETRMGDKRAAAALGQQAGQLRSQNIQQATSQSLARSAATGDRMQLRESVKQAAAQLRISQDQVMANFIGDKQRNLMQKYGIDVGAAIDAAKLNEQSAEFKEDLAFKMQQLEQTLGMQGRALGSEEERFATEMQYKYDVFNNQLDQQDWERRAVTDALGLS